MDDLKPIEHPTIRLDMEYTALGARDSVAQLAWSAGVHVSLPRQVSSIPRIEAFYRQVPADKFKEHSLRQLLRIHSHLLGSIISRNSIRRVRGPALGDLDILRWPREGR